MEPGVRVGGDHHAINLSGWPEVVEKDPCPNAPQVSVREVALDVNLGACGELDDARIDYQTHTSRLRPARHPRNQRADSLLIVAVFGVLACRNLFGEAQAADEESG